MDGEEQDNPEILLNTNKDNLLDDAQRSTNEEVASHPKIKQPGGQGDDQRRNWSKINLCSEVRFCYYIKITIILNKYPFLEGC